MLFGPARLQWRQRKKLPLILQEEIADCAHACIAMIARYWGANLSLSAVRRIHQTSARGVNALQINRILHQLGFKTRVLRVVIQHLDKIKAPAILHWNNNHFVVLKQVRKHDIIVHDPAIGARKVMRSEIHQFFSGIVLEIEKTDHFTQIQANPPLTIFKIIKLLAGMPKLLSILLFLSLIIELLQLINPMLMQYITDHVLGSNTLVQMYQIGLGCIVFGLIHGLTEFCRSHLILYAAITITESFASDVFKHLLQLPLSCLAHRHLNDIQSKFQVIDQLKIKLSTDLFQTGLDGIMMLVIFAIMGCYCPVLTGVMAGMFGVYALCLGWNIRLYRLQAGTSVSMHAKTAVTFYEALRGIAPIKAFLQETHWFQLWRNEYVDALNHDIEMSTIQIRFRILNQMLFHTEYVLILCIGAELVIAQRLTIGMLLAFLAYRMLLANKAAAFIQYLFSYHGLTQRLQRLQDLLEQEPEPILPSLQPIQQTPKELHIQNLTFSYPGSNQAVFRAVDFSIQVGDRIAIIGSSGCGKTTLLKILMGFEQPTAGTILIDNMPLPLFGIQNFRQLSASVMQDDVLFTGSILDNITFFSEEVAMNDVYEAAKLACIHDTIMAMPMGYESPISQHQALISGGQRQRILLARALHKKPQFLFLDEATSHLDAQLERQINQALRNCEMTQIVVAHRPETIAMADRVIDLERWQ